jgi:hypothetical protein
MKVPWHHQNPRAPEEPTGPADTPFIPPEIHWPHKMHHHRKLKISGGVVLFLIVALIAGRIYLPYWLTDYVNKTLDNIPGYTGSISDVDVALLRGAYTIDDLKIMKKEGGIPVPFVDIKKTDLSLQWGALFKGEVVGEVILYGPILNFATNKSGSTTQTGLETDWTMPIKELMPLDVNFVEIHNGKITYKNFNTRPNVDIYINNLEGKATNIRNVEDKNARLPSSVTLRGQSIGGGALAVDGHMNIIKQIPDIDIDAKLEKVNLPALNNYAQAFAGIDFNSGNFDLYTEMKVTDGQVTGYIKPLLRNIDLIDWQNPDPNPLNILWESVVSVVLEIFSNQSKDQVATQIKLEGNIDSPETDFWSTIGGILHNAFVQAYSNTIKEE